ncbi:MAG: hypothetical protein HOV81_25505 [Kofleriaceae bacterium]|nr:hypothetical protein [Kofleriaceae bacterium]
MRALVVVAVLVGCKDPVPVAPDAEPPPPDAAVIPDFYGEPCAPVSTPLVAVLCHLDAPQHDRGYCTPAGICRPPCGYTINSTYYPICLPMGGIETWTLPDHKGICYCDPPR